MHAFHDEVFPSDCRFTTIRNYKRKPSVAEYVGTGAPRITGVARFTSRIAALFAHRFLDETACVPGSPSFDIHCDGTGARVIGHSDLVVLG